jgi:hypothetical protein
MQHYLTIGFLNPDAVPLRRIEVQARLDPELLSRLLRKYSDSTNPSKPTFEGNAVVVREGYVRCPWYLSHPVETSVKFALELQEATGCVMADVEHGRLITPDVFTAEDDEDPEDLDCEPE